MKYTLYIGILFFAWTCSPKHSGQVQSDSQQQETPESIQEGEFREDQSEQEESVEDGVHYAVNFNFTKDKATPTSGAKIPEDLPYVVIPTNEWFVVIYEEGKLVYYQQLPNPLAARRIGPEREVTTTEESGAGTILFPDFVMDSSRSLNIYVYEISNYVENFETIIQSKPTTNNLTLRYQIDQKALIQFLRSL